MDQQVFNFWTFVLQIATVLAASIFAFWQIKINDRMKKLQDYVAISVVPTGTFAVKLINVGRINLYLKRYEIGRSTESFPKPLLIPAGTGEISNLLISLSNIQPKMPMKFYLIDELGDEYLSTGQIFTTPIKVPNLDSSKQSGTNDATAPSIQPVQLVLTDMRIWSYKTEKYNWKI